MRLTIVVLVLATMSVFAGYAFPGYSTSAGAAATPDHGGDTLVGLYAE